MKLRDLTGKEVAKCSQFSSDFATFTYSPRSIPELKTAEVFDVQQNPLPEIHISF